MSSCGRDGAEQARSARSSGVVGHIRGPVHFVGIGGAAQRAAAELLLGWGVAVQGSDVVDSPALTALAARGARVYVGHAAVHVGEARLCVVSSAVPAGNPEVEEARRQRIPVLSNAELERLIGVGRRTLAIAGTHGKTTTTAMLAWTLVEAGLDPLALVGSEAVDLGGSSRPGRGTYFVIEADEYDRRFLALEPWAAAVLNVEPDHLDYYGTVDHLITAFRTFVERVPDDGFVMLCADDPGALALQEAVSRGRVQTYGIGQGDWQARAIRTGPEGSEFTVWHEEHAVVPCHVRMMGLHNVRNALASLAMAVSIGVAPLAAAGALERFRGTRRRFELADEAAGVVVVIDYGHHPTEIQATLAAARQRYPGRRLWLVFQPHTYARTQSLFDGFLASCREADEVMLVATYVPPGRERVRDDALTRELAQRLGGAYVESIGAVVDELARRLTAGDVVLLMGAGDINQVAEPLVKTLERRRDALE